MTKQDEIRELEGRLGREVAIEYYKNLKRVVSERDFEEYEPEMYMNVEEMGGENTRLSVIL